MAILAIDTAGPDCAVALARQAGRAFDIIGSEVAHVGRGHSDILIPMIGRTLSAAHLDYADLHRIAVTIGPGSFTGIRAGIAAARGLALALDIPAVGVGVLDALAEAALAGGSGGVVVSTLDARRGEIYALAVHAATRAVLLPSTVGTPESIAERIAALAGDSELDLTGSGADLLQATLARHDLRARIVGRDESAGIGAVAGLGLLAAADPLPTPLYLRGPDAKAQTGKAVPRQ